MIFLAKAHELVIILTSINKWVTKDYFGATKHLS